MDSRNMDSKIFENYKLWLESDFIDEETKRELYSIKQDEKEIEDRFFKELEFGTAGLRGIIGAGTNRINKYIVRKVTQGLANHIKDIDGEAKYRGVVIAYDCRRMSRQFAEEAATVLTGNGIKVYLFNSLRPTPVLSFAIRHLKCISGIVITASHNPAEYNGLKVYWEDGAQIANKKSQGLIDSIACVSNFGSIRILDKSEAIDKNLLFYLGDEIDAVYIKEVRKQSLRGDIVRKVAKDFKIVFTPLHGTGNILVRKLLKEIGFKNVLVVPEQELPDPEFSTLKYPNPEDKESFKLAIELAEKENVDLIIGTDPDCDRVGVIVKDTEGEYIAFTGNQVGALLVEYILATRREKNTLPQDGVIIKTIVTSNIGEIIARKYGVETLSVLTGFKYIGERIEQIDETERKTFLFGYEESCGYLAGTYARDKDAVVASMLICEMAAYYYSKGVNLYTALMDLYDRYGYFLDDIKSINLYGKEGIENIVNIMEYFRNVTLDSIGDKKVIYKEDYDLQKRIYLNILKDIENIELPKANVIKFILEDDGWIALRPSGTEPKLKIYAGFKESTLEETRETLDRVIDWMEEKIQDILRRELWRSGKNNVRLFKNT